jgi:hypothetical protein
MIARRRHGGPRPARLVAAGPHRGDQ